MQERQKEVYSTKRKGKNGVSRKAFQDFYPDELSWCYGCGRLNEHGLRIKSYWDGEESVATYTPEDMKPEGMV